MANMLRRTGAAFFTAAAVLVGALTHQAAAADMVRGVYAADPGVCGNSRVLGSISSKFGYQVRHVPNLPQVGISEFLNIRENRFQPSQPDWPIERRYCQASVYLTDGYTRDVWYLIEHPMGFAGIGSNVEFCVLGFDRWKVYGGNCRVLR
ncbi:hypothetical protein [Aliihoeflea aestuarii]|jgi:hypothetical protein|uniref:hypothetical protein n=1 Tax=Aliihoeflea aestuarii TaxID=453840 RepID=UPI002095D11B|nr:hypothetical protein [Aliihoeflea aestuarii]